MKKPINKENNPVPKPVFFKDKGNTMQLGLNTEKIKEKIILLKEPLFIDPNVLYHQFL